MQRYTLKNSKSKILGLSIYLFLLCGNFALGVDINKSVKDTLNKSESFLIDVQKLKQKDNIQSNLTQKDKIFEIKTSSKEPYNIPITITFSSTPSIATGYWYLNGVFMGTGKSFSYTFEDVAKYKVELLKKRGTKAIAIKNISILPSKSKKESKISVKKLFSNLPSTKRDKKQQKSKNSKIEKISHKDIKLWGEQSKDFEKGIVEIKGNSVNITKKATITRVDIYPVNFKTIKKSRGFCIWRGTTQKKATVPLFCGGIKKSTILGRTLKKGSYTLLPDLGLHVEIELRTSNVTPDHNVEIDTTEKVHDIGKIQ